jgi:hypothetical protein
MLDVYFLIVLLEPPHLGKLGGDPKFASRITHILICSFVVAVSPWNLFINHQFHKSSMVLEDTVPQLCGRYSKNPT